MRPLYRRALTFLGRRRPDGQFGASGRAALRSPKRAHEGVIAYGYIAVQPEAFNEHCARAGFDASGPADCRHEAAFMTARLRSWWQSRLVQAFIALVITVGLGTLLVWGFL